MSNYADIEFNGTLRNLDPAIISAIQFLYDDDDEERKEFKEKPLVNSPHPFFTLPRWDMIFSGGHARLINGVDIELMIHASVSYGHKEALAFFDLVGRHTSASDGITLLGTVSQSDDAPLQNVYLHVSGSQRCLVLLIHPESGFFDDNLDVNETIIPILP